jgi:lipoprotein-anchoring transpeptidase ErfK/SrfK
MNSLKTMAMVGVLMLVACGVYMSINNGPVQAPPEAPEDWSAGPPQISLPGADDSGAPDFAMGGPSGLPSPGTPPVQGRSSELSPYRPFPGRAPAPPFSAAPLPPEISSDLNAPLPAALSEPYPHVPGNQLPPPFRSDGNLVGTAPPVTNAPLPDFSSSAAPPLPPGTTTGMETPRKPLSTEIRPQFVQLLAEARRDLEQGRFRETLSILSSRYGEPDQTAAEAAALAKLLDQVAGTVIYSTEHHLEPAYVVQVGETLPQIALKYDVPTELLAKINTIHDPMRLQPGQELKVVRGPFRAVVRLEKHEMDLWLQDLYAGRFAIGVGADKPDLEGNFLVLEKHREPAYYSPTGRVFDSNDPLNPLGKRRIGLGDSVAIHGTNDQGNIGQTGGPGVVRLGEQDTDDVFDILSLGSRVVIQR